MSAYYNEIEPYAAEWLRNLIAAGHIAPGDVDERSIEDVCPDDLRGYAQCHFFAGIGVWSYALRRAGWDDDERVWTGSCPCQPFSAAGKGDGFADERHLWPAFYWLILQCRAPVIFGEQVASKDADPWIDLVQADLEAMAYSFGAIPFPAAGVGAPNIRDRLYWMAHAQIGGRGKERQNVGRGAARNRAQGVAAGSLPGISTSGLGDASSSRLEKCFGNSRVAGRPTGTRQGEAAERAGIHIGTSYSGPANGFWRDADWIGCRDGKFRPVEPGTFPLVDGSAFRLDSGSPFAGKSRAGMLKGAGNAINAEAAIAFLQCAP